MVFRALTPLRRNAVANILGRVGTAALWIAVTPHVLSQLGPERFGIWSLFFAFNTYLLSLDLGVGGTLVRFIAAQRPTGDRRALTKTLRWGLGVAFSLGIIWSVCIVVGREWIATAFHVPAAMRSETMAGLLIFAGSALLMFPAQVLLASLQGFERMDLSNLCMFLGVAAQTVALVLGVSAGGGVVAAAVATVVGQTVSGLLAGLLLRRLMAQLPAGGLGTGPRLRDLIGFGGALQVLGVLNALHFQSGRIVLAIVGNLGMVTDYELAMRVSTAAYSLPILIQGAVIPTVSRTEQSEGLAAVEKLFASATRWIFTNSVVVLGSLWILAPDIVQLWLGPGKGQIPALIRLACVAFAICLTYSPGVAIARGLGRPWFEVWSYGAAVITHIGLGVWLVARYGTPGAIVALGSAFVVGFVIFVPLFHSRCGIPFARWFRGEFAPRVLAGVLAVALAAALLGAGPVAAQLPGPGLVHGAVAGLIFLTIFALLFLPMGDTQRLAVALWHMTGAVVTRRLKATSHTT